MLEEGREKPWRRLRSSYFSTLPASVRWRNRIQSSRVVALVASLLLQRCRWQPFLEELKPKLRESFSADPNLLFLVLARSKSLPHAALGFFQWSETALGLQMDLRCRCKMAQILIDGGIPAPARGVMAPAILCHTTMEILDAVGSLTRRIEESRSAFLGFLFEEYALSDRIQEGLLVFRRFRATGCRPSSRTCNVFLDRLISSGEIRLASCFYAAVVRSGVAADSRSWSLLCRLLCEEGKLEIAAAMVESSPSCDGKVFHLIADRYCRNGDFLSAILLLNTMYEKDLRPGLGIYGAILEGGCRLRNTAIIRSCLKETIVRGLLPTAPVLDYDLIIQRLCDLEKTYAAEFFMERARSAKASHSNGTYLCLLRALSAAGRVEEAVGVHRQMMEKGVKVNQSCLNVFFRAVCQGEASDEGGMAIRDLIGKGFLPCVSDISKFMGNLCRKGWWKEAEDLLNLVLGKGIVPEADCCSHLIQNFCANRDLDSAMSLLEKLRAGGGGLDVKSYNLLLDELSMGGRLTEAIMVFDHMGEEEARDSRSFCIMISALCRGRELRKAMNLHDAMMKLELKPDEEKYRQIISGWVNACPIR
ncbi:unnamed protein product [Spirodela intermedia]|uniref:Uncharacterized protein n=1 Tax=Spirodela intermedia TaxID=51605 RepID=A0A7I8K9Q6_SPIIN|nr:unnamed protein product [Spirodela intermedia]